MMNQNQKNFLLNKKEYGMVFIVIKVVVNG